MLSCNNLCHSRSDTPLPFLVLASPPALVCVVETPAWFLSDFQALPVLALYPPACSPLLQTTRPRALVTHSANALEENTINVNIIAAIRITLSFLRIGMS